eukprot:5424002-Amphidinium_carterae.2
MRKEVHLVVDAQGVWKPRTSPSFTADVSTDLMIVFALERRGVALDISHIMPFEIHQMWVEELVDKRLQTAPPGFVAITLAQLREADRALFQMLSDECRHGLQ